MQPGGATHGDAADAQRGVSTPAFRRLWWAWTVSLCGDGVRALALPLYVVITFGDPLDVSAVSAAEVLPWLLFALPAGAIVDRVRPRQVVIVAHVLRAVLTAALVVMILLGTADVVWLCLFAFVLTAAETFAYPASQVLMVELAGPDELDKANARFFSVHTIGLNLVGPLAAGSLFVIDPAITFAVDGASFVIAAILIATLPAAAPKIGETASELGRGLRGLGAEVRSGVRMLFANRGLRTLVSMVAAGTLAISAVNAMLPLYAVQRLEMSAALVPTLLVVMALGTLLANQVVPALARRWSDGSVMVASMFLVGAGMCLIGAYPHPVVAWSGNAVLGLGLGGWNVLSAARRQRLTPAGAMGRISGAYRVVAWGLLPIGAALAGPIAVATSLGWVFVIAGGFVLTLLALLSLPLLTTGASTPAQPSLAPPADADVKPAPKPRQAAPKPPQATSKQQASH